MSHQSTLPVETIEKIIAFALCPAKDDPQRLPSPTSRAHPLSLLLVSAGFTQLALPHFYLSIFIRKPQDWSTLFNSTDGVLGATEGARWLPPLDVRRAWVEELFLGLNEDGEPIRLPLNIEAARKGRLDDEAIRRWCNKTSRKPDAQAHSRALDLILLPLAAIVLPNLTHLVVTPLPVVPPPPPAPTQRTRPPKILTETETFIKLVLGLPHSGSTTMRSFGQEDIKRVIHHQQVQFFTRASMFLLGGLRTLSYPQPVPVPNPTSSHAQVPSSFFRTLLSPSELICGLAPPPAEHIVYGSKASGLKSNGLSLLDMRVEAPAVFVGAEAEIRDVKAMGEESLFFSSVKRWRWRRSDGREVPFLEAWPGWTPPEDWS